MVMGTQATSVYQQVIEKTKGMMSRTQELARNIEKRLNIDKSGYEGVSESEKLKRKNYQLLRKHIKIIYQSMKRLKASVAELSAVVSHKVIFAHVFSLSGKTDATIAILLTKSSVCLKIRAFWLKTSFVLDKNCNTTIRFRRAIHQVCKTLQNQCVKHEGPLNG